MMMRLKKLTLTMKKTVLMMTMMRMKMMTYEDGSVEASPNSAC